MKKLKLNRLCQEKLDRNESEKIKAGAGGYRCACGCICWPEPILAMAETDLSTDINYIFYPE